MPYKLVIICDEDHNTKYRTLIEDEIDNLDEEEEEEEEEEEKEKKIKKVDTDIIDTDDFLILNVSRLSKSAIETMAATFLKGKTNQNTIFYIFSHGGNTSMALTTDTDSKTEAMTTNKTKAHFMYISQEPTGEFFDLLYKNLQHPIRAILGSCEGSVTITNNQIKNPHVSLLARGGIKGKILMYETFKTLQDVILCIGKNYNYQQIVKFILAHDPETFRLQIGTQDSELYQNSKSFFRFPSAERITPKELTDNKIEIKKSLARTEHSKKTDFGVYDISDEDESSNNLNNLLGQKLLSSSIQQHLLKRTEEIFPDTAIPDLKKPYEDPDNQLKRQLFQYCNRKNLKAVKAILDQNPHLLYIEDNLGVNLMSVAGRKKNIGIAKYLLELGFYDDYKDSNKYSDYFLQFINSKTDKNEIKAAVNEQEKNIIPITIKNLDYAIQHNKPDYAYKTIIRNIFVEDSEKEILHDINSYSTTPSKHTIVQPEPCSLNSLSKFAKENKKSQVFDFLSNIEKNQLVRDIIHCNVSPDNNYEAKEVNSQDKFGITPLMIAVIKGDIELVDHLINNLKADITLKDSKGRTAFDFAKERLMDEFLSHERRTKYKDIIHTIRSNSTEPQTPDPDLKAKKIEKLETEKQEKEKS